MRTLLAALLIMSAPTAAVQEGAEVTVFWDRDGNGVRGDDEPGYAEAEIAIRDELGYTATVRTKEDGTYRLPHAGKWQVSHDEDKFATTTPTVVQVDGKDVAFGVRGAKVCGTVWLDSDFDGQIGEPERRVAGHRITAGVGLREAITAADGTYCVNDLPTGHIHLYSADRSKIDQTTWAYTRLDDPDFEGRSKFDMLRGGSEAIAINTPDTVITDIDSAFVEPRGMDVRVNEISTTKVGGDIRVGDHIKVICDYELMGNVPDLHSATLTLPEGFEVVNTEGTTATKAGRQVRGAPMRRPPGQKEQLIAVVDVEQPFTSGEIRCETTPGALGDNIGTNNVMTTNVGAAGVVERGRSTPFLLAVGALALAVAVWVTVRKRRTTDRQDQTTY